MKFHLGDITLKKEFEVEWVWIKIVIEWWCFKKILIEQNPLHKKI